MARILVVEDDQALAFLLNLFFSTRHDVVVATNRSEAIIAIESENFDYLITDYLHEEAIAVLRAFRRKFPSAPAILTTGFDQEDVEVKAKEAGATYLLHKPLGLNEFAKYIPNMGDVPLKRNGKTASTS